MDRQVWSTRVHHRCTSGVALLRLGLLAMLVGVFTLSAPAAQRPNIVIFIADDYSAFDASPYGARDLRTPNMQRIADASLAFDQAFVASPSCAPSRAALLTGLMPARNGAEPNHSRPRPDVKKWPAYFQELGYEVVAFGKVSHYEHTADYGFDSFAHDTFHDHAGIAASARFLKARSPESTRPLCLFVGSNWPHVPWPMQTRGIDPEALRLPAGSVDTTVTRERRMRYAAAVSSMDDDLGVVHDAARAAFGDDMIFVMSSDHGTQWPFGKWNCYDAGIKVPLLVNWPGVVKPATRTSAMVSWVDLLPTLLEAAGGKAPSDLDGRSFLRLLRAGRGEHREQIFTTHSGDGRWNIYPTRSVRSRNWKYILNLHPEYAFTSHIDLADDPGMWPSWEEAAKTDPQAAAIVERYHKRPAEELYDLAADPHEQRNLASDPQHARRRKQMRAELEEWMEAQGDQRTVYDKPRLLSDPSSYGSDAVPDAETTAPRKRAQGKQLAPR